MSFLVLTAALKKVKNLETLGNTPGILGMKSFINIKNFYLLCIEQKYVHLEYVEL